MTAPHPRDAVHALATPFASAISRWRRTGLTPSAATLALGPANADWAEVFVRARQPASVDRIQGIRHEVRERAAEPIVFDGARRTYGVEQHATFILVHGRVESRRDAGKLIQVRSREVDGRIACRLEQPLEVEAVR